MKYLAPLLLGSVILLGCGGGGGSGGHAQTPPNSAAENPGSSDNNFNSGLTGKLYFNHIYFYRKLDLVTGHVRNLHTINQHGVSMPNHDASEFVQDFNDSPNGSYQNEDIVFLNADGQETGRREIKGDVG